MHTNYSHDMWGGPTYYEAGGYALPCMDVPTNVYADLRARTPG